MNPSGSDKQYKIRQRSLPDKHTLAMATPQGIHSSSA